MISNLIRYSEIILPFIIFSPGLRGLGIVFYSFLIYSLIFSIPLLSSSFFKIFKSKFSTVLVLFYIITVLGLIPSFTEFDLETIFVTLSRVFLCIVFVLVCNSYKNRISSIRLANIYLITTFIAASFIYIQYFTGPLNIFSEIFSTRAGLPRFATVSGSANIFSVSVAFSILISTCIYDRVNFLKIL